MFDRHTHTQGAALIVSHRRILGISILKALAFAAVALLASGLTSNVEALVGALEIELPSVQGWQIQAVNRSGSVMCSARQREESSTSMTLLADTGKYRGGVWFLGVASRNQHLEPGVEETVARLFLDGKHVATGTAVATIGAFVRFDFPAIDAYVEDIKAARVVEVKAQGLSPLQLESLSPVITAIEQCRKDGLNPEFWNGAEHTCN